MKYIYVFCAGFEAQYKPRTAVALQQELIENSQSLLTFLYIGSGGLAFGFLYRRSGGLAFGFLYRGSGGLAFGLLYIESEGLVFGLLYMESGGLAFGLVLLYRYRGAKS